MAVKQRDSSEKKPRGKGKPFKPNDPETGEKDERINRKGRLMPKSLIELQDIIDEIFAETIKDSSGNEMDKLSIALNRLLLHKNPAGAIHVLDRRFGKVPQNINMEIQDELTDDERIARLTALLDAARARRDGQTPK